MSLTVGSGPFSTHPAGVFNFRREGPSSVIYFEDVPRRIRGRLAGETVVDSRHAKLLHETGHLPVYYFPEDEVRMDLLEPTDRHTHCPFKGDASYWTLRAGGQVKENTVWSYPEPLESSPPLAGYLAFYWDALDEWLEEDEPMIVHARDPYHRVDVLDTSRHVRVLVDGEVVADSTAARVLFETGLPPRWYLPREDVRAELLVPSDTSTGCPYKGIASYYSVRTEDRLEQDVVWYYPEPLHDAERIAGRLCFFDERVDVEIDGERQARPETQWSKR